MAHILEFELPDPAIYADMTDGVLFVEIDRLEMWLTVLDFLYVSTARSLVEAHSAGGDVRIPKRREQSLIHAVRRYTAVRANLRVANDEYQRRMSELAQRIATA